MLGRWHVARLASKLRAKYPAIKLPDAIQLSASILADAKGFITNDETLKQIREIPVVILREFI